MHDISTQAGRDAYIAECEQAIEAMDRLRREQIRQYKKSMVDAHVHLAQAIISLCIDPYTFREGGRRRRVRELDDTYSLIA